MIDEAISLALERKELLTVPDGTVSYCAGIISRLDDGNADWQTVAVTSARPREGRSTVATGLAIASATIGGRPTVLVDLSRGIGDEVVGEDGQPESVAPQMRSVRDQVEWVLPDLGVLGGKAGAANVVTRADAGRLLAELRLVGQRIIVDLPAMPPHGTADRFVTLVDALVLVVRAGSTPTEEVVAAARGLPGTPLVVLNETRSSIPGWMRGGRSG